MISLQTNKPCSGCELAVALTDRNAVREHGGDRILVLTEPIGAKRSGHWPEAPTLASDYIAHPPIGPVETAEPQRATASHRGLAQVC